MVAALLAYASTNAALADVFGTFLWSESNSTGMKVGTSPGNLSYNGNINTATYFEIGGLVARGFNATGVFSGMTSQNLGPVDFNLANDSSLTFGNSYLGSFQSAKLSVVQNNPGTLLIYVLGTFTSGSYTGNPTPFSNVPASFTVSLNQSPAFNGIISDSGLLSIPPSTIVPEPSSTVLVGAGLLSLVVFRLRSRKWMVNEPASA